MKKFFSDNNPISGYNTDFDYPTEKSTEQTDSDSEQYRCASGTSPEEQYCIKDDSKLLRKAEEAFIDSEGERGTFFARLLGVDLGARREKSPRPADAQQKTERG